MRRVLALVPLLASSLIAGSPAQAASTYSQPNWLRWNTRVVDVLIVPPAHGQVFNGNGALGGTEGGVGEATPFNSYLRAIEDAIAAWDTAIATYGAPWLKTLTTNVYVVGRDTIPSAALTGPEIVVTTDENKAVVLGVAVSTRPCFIAISKFFVQSFTYADMFSVGGHEYGHCMGLDHTFGSPSDATISHDMMHATYVDPVGARGTHKHCPSNLNVLGLERAFAGAFGQTPSGGTATLSSTSYQKIAC